MNLLRTDHIDDPDGYYDELVSAQRDMSDDQADRFLAKLVLILSNHVADRAVLREAIGVARRNTLGNARGTTLGTPPGREA